jgi:tetratricopeptide (TPR) repeat protein
VRVERLGQFEERMRPIQTLVFTWLVCCSGCAALPTLSNSEEGALARSESSSQAPADLIYGQSAAARGDWNAALAFFQRSYREKPSLLNEFNLATAYQRTGRGDLAVPLYLDLVDRGQQTEVTPIENTNGSFDQKAPASDIADEARERLIRMHASSLLTNRSSGP